MSKKIGLLLGSFDPPHIGHLNACFKALEKVSLDMIWVIPTWQNPWKEKKPADIDERVLMFQFMIGDIISKDEKDFPVIVSNIEGELKPQYSYQLIDYLVNEHSEFDYYIIGGQDIQEQIKDWKNSQFILDNCKFIEIDRNEINISSTQIREMIKGNKPLYPFLTKNEIKYLKFNNLYKE
jgi:nicotinate-nucleotide adenylyltransferase